MSVLDIFGALSMGATLVIPPSEFYRLFPAIFIEHFNINIWNSVPSVFQLIVNSGHLDESRLKSLKFITFCGEPLLVKLVNSILQTLPEVILQNTYGPTEATVSCTSIQFTSTSDILNHNNIVSIGMPIPGIYLSLDHSAPPVSKGELSITGDQVALGYLNATDQQASKFSEGINPLDSSPLRSFATGDMVLKSMMPIII